MEGDDDTFIVIIGKEDEEPFPAHLEIKEEISSDHENEMVADAKPIELETTIFKTEPSDDESERNLEGSDESDLYFIEDPMGPLSSDSNDDMAEEEEKETRRTQLLKPHERISYVNNLRKEYPELKEDRNLLITCLVELMKNTKPPPLPQDYFIMNGIMMECLKCGHMSRTIPAAGRHYLEKHGPRYLVCYGCGCDFRSKTNLYKHEKRCNSPDARIVLRARALTLGDKCRSRPYIPKLKKKEPKKYECSECSATYSNKYTLRAHELVHRGERPHRCHTCGAAYTSRTALCRHIKKHGTKEYICDHCQRSFKIRAALIVHLDTHRPEKRFGCSECPKRYSQKTALLRHVERVHRRLPPPCACKLCHKRYPRMSLLKDHMKKVHGMLIITRKMFFKQLPTLSSTKIEQGKLIFKNEDDVN